MPGPEQIIPHLEGIVGSLAGGKQSVSDWVQMCKMVMKSAANKDKTTWQFVSDANVVEATSAILASTCTVYGLLIGNISAAVEANFFYMTDIAAGDAVGTETDVDDWFIYQIPPAAVSGTEEFWPFVFPAGINFAAGLDVLADGNAGTNPTANTIRCWILYAV